MGRRSHQARGAGAPALSRIIRSRTANRDMDGIWDYIARESIPHADAFVDRIENKLKLLAENPWLGPARDDLEPGIRSLTAGNYLIFYHPVPDGIRLARVLHASRNLSEALRRR